MEVSGPAIAIGLLAIFIVIVSKTTGHGATGAADVSVNSMDPVVPAGGV